jgi:hypothetical protein
MYHVVPIGDTIAVTRYDDTKPSLSHTIYSELNPPFREGVFVKSGER